MHWISTPGMATMDTDSKERYATANKCACHRWRWGMRFVFHLM